MRFYTHQHKFYCGIDLHASSMYVCIINQDGEILVHRSLSARPDRFLKIIEPYRDDLVVAVECMFTWYWLADLCAQQWITFVPKKPARTVPAPNPLQLTSANSNQFEGDFDCLRSATQIVHVNWLTLWVI